MSRFTIFICLLLISLILVSCKKDEENPVGSYDLHKVDPIMAAYSFAPGSTWIYENLADGRRDTVEVMSVNRTLLHEAIHSYSSDMVLFNRQYQSSISGVYFESLFTVYISRGGPYEDFIFMPESQVGFTSVGATVLGGYKSMTIGTHTFHIVTKMHTSTGRFLPEPMHLYFSPNVGIIRKELIRADTVYATWDLVDWQVPPYPID